MRQRNSRASGGACRTARPNGAPHRSWMLPIAWSETSGRTRRGWSRGCATCAADVRIIAGQWRGRTIKAPKDSRVRPTGDRAREAWMSIVGPQIPGARVLDLYAGSGALGLEALSRGAASADFVDVAPAAIKMIRENGATLGALDRMYIHRAE